MYGQRQGGGFRIPPTFLIAVVMAGFALCKYYGSSSHNEITGETQHISISPQQEIAMGLQSAPQMAQEFGGLSSDRDASAIVKQIGQRIVQNSAAAKTPYQYDFHLLADRQTINAFALPGGQVFITEALLYRLSTDGQTLSKDMLAGVLGHEVGHVVARHSAEKLAQMELAQGITGAVTMATYDPSNPNSGYMAQMVANMLQLKYGREQELQSDYLGVRFMLEAGFEPESLIQVMEVLKQAAGPNRTPEFQSTHPDPENRQEAIRAAIQEWRGKLGK
ncbi:MAG: M48 family metallopeptidase [Lewinellaceae bacterium]|nr:M48 family metallopeptidase [Saprospiraceae bacterium]MCB0545588.1 M48 family metallopeptidase [Saprospiraceae bacterium]MCB9307869.1 M48 family metallopeptidase [Lewinellaceae bacterium]MCB9356332.1 M48 family metallopeptidase [Lewinellaceae bacterium]